MNIKQALAQGRSALQSTSDAPQLDSERLLLHVLKRQESTWLITHDDTALSRPDTNRYLSLLKERAEGRPLAYILGCQQFLKHTFKVNRHVLIPRPATEQLFLKSKTVIQQLHLNLNRPLNVADIGTGSGCLAISLALAFPETVLKNIYATDISSAALQVAKHNAVSHRVDHRLTFKKGHLLDPLSSRQIDLIISNPPYVPTPELAAAKHSPTADTSGLNFEPNIALDGGPDGQRFITTIINTKTPAVLETTGGLIRVFNL